MRRRLVGHPLDCSRGILRAEAWLPLAALAVSIGAGNSATGAGAVAIGDPSVANGTGAVALGGDAPRVEQGTEQYLLDVDGKTVFS